MIAGKEWNSVLMCIYWMSLIYDAKTVKFCFRIPVTFQQ